MTKKFPKVTILNGKPDKYDYLFWQLGLLVTLVSMLLMVSLSADWLATDTEFATKAILVTLTSDLFASFVLWHLIDIKYSRSKRFALAVAILADILTKLLVLRQFNDDLPLFHSVWYALLVIFVAFYLIGSAIIGLIIFIRGDDIVPWWKK